MTINERLLALRKWASDNATECMFPFWTSDYIKDEVNGGYYGTITLDMQRKNDIDRSLVLYGRMVYAFSTAYKVFGKQEYLDAAKYTYDYLIDKFYDPEFGGAYSAVTTEGEPINTDKSVYHEAFFVMACAAYYNASGDEDALAKGMDAFEKLESARSGPATYYNAIARDWTEQNNPTQTRVMFPKGTIVFPHHLCQAYEQLYRATGSEKVRESLRDLALFLIGPGFDKENKCFTTFVDNEGKRVGTRQSLGHDCEISYLAYDVAELVGDEEILAKMKEVCTIVLERVLEVGFDPWNSLYNSYDVATMVYSDSHVWWAQAEAGNAMIFGYWLTGDEKYLVACEKQIDYIDKYFINREHGDWYSNIVVDEDGWRIVDGSHGFDKLNAGKCPFHNSHMDFDIIRRVDDILAR